jgi:hypothetical protein
MEIAAESLNSHSGRLASCRSPVGWRSFSRRMPVELSKSGNRTSVVDNLQRIVIIVSRMLIAIAICGVLGTLACGS